jgi:hypothetical protein
MFLASDVMDSSASLLNDTAKRQFTYAVQIPYLNMALDELREVLQLNNAPLTNKVDESIVVVAGVLNVGGGGSSPLLPTDLVEIQDIYERQNGLTEDWQPMTRRDFLPSFVQQIESLTFWTWQGQQINFIGATTDRQLRINYISDGVPVVHAQTTQIAVINAKTFLFYRTAALIAQFIGENKERSDDLNGFAMLAIDRLTGINAKGRQAIFTRRRPFQAAHKVRSAW